MNLLFYKGTRKENPEATFWDNFICFVTRSRFSHVELATAIGVSMHRCWSSSSRDGGVRCANIPFSDSWVEIQVQDVDPNWFLPHKGKKYDYIGLIGTILKVPYFSSKDKWFCSEILAEALGLPNSWEFTPEKLYQLYSK